ncbi:MAG: nucleotidyltransferase domain-containing protein [Planctomycetes bacterium]|nr:nucleotidyltransferase domain-containing protein [Planctomycetota bacterium]MBM4079548.1 nucleotidyltransferase domain-containing protein [Planctomycetota bacterium]
MDDALIRDIVQKIVAAFHPRRIILFGSRARGEQRADSDVDLFVEMESNDRPIQRRLRIRELFWPQWWGMDLLVLTPQEVARQRHSHASLVPVIEKEGKLLYERRD